MHHQQHTPGATRPGKAAPSRAVLLTAVALAALAIVAGLNVLSLPPWAPSDPTPSAASTPSSDPASPATPAPNAVVLDDGRAVAPPDAPAAVSAMVDAANELVGLPYRYGGGHRPYDELPLDTGYDGSGAVSYVLHSADLLATPITEEELTDFGASGPGDWVTIVACGSAYLVIGDLAFGSGADGVVSIDATAGPHWRSAGAPDPDCVTRHPEGL
jgi:hypothetical protein